MPRSARRASRGLGVLLLFAAGLAASSLLSDGAVAAPEALTLTKSLCGVEVNCATVTIEPDLNLPDNGSATYASSPSGITCALSPLPAPNGPVGEAVTGQCRYVFSWAQTQTTLDLTMTRTLGPGTYYSYNGVTNSTPTFTSTILLGQGVQVGFPGYFRLIAESLGVSTSGIGTGKVTIQPAGTVCSAACTSSADYGTKVTLTAAPDAGATFLQWTGACNGQGAVCNLQPTAALSTNAVFGLASQTTTASTTTTAKTTTSTPTTTATATTTTSATTTGSATVGSRQTLLSAELVAVKTARSKLGAREIEIEISTNETAAVSLSLVRGNKTLAVHTTLGLHGGDRVLTLIVPHGVAKGGATLRVTIKAGGGHKSFHAGIAVPHA